MSVDIGELRGIITLQDQFSGPIEKVAGALGISSKSFERCAQFAGLAAGAVTAAAAAIVYLGDRGSAVDDVRGSFTAFAQEAGSTADVMLGALRTATDSTISDFDLMKMSGNALGAGLVKTKEDMATLAAGARLLADRTGGDTKEAFDQLTGAMESGRTKTLASMGVFIDAEKVVKDYAQANNLTVESLDKQERAQIVSQATLAALRAEMVRSGEVQADFSDRIAQGKVAVQNFVDNLGLAVAKSPVVAAGMDAMAAAVQNAFGGNQQQAVQTLMGYVNDFAIGVASFARLAVQAADFVVQGFYGIRAGFNTVLEFFYAGVTKAADLVADLAAKGADLPGVGDGLAAISEGARAIAEGAQAASIGFAEVAVEAGASANAASAAFGAVEAGLTATITAMEAAKTTSVDLTVANEGTSRGLQEIAGTAAAAGQSFFDMAELSVESYNRTWELAQETATKEMELQQAVALARTSGVEQQLLQIEFQRQAELTALQEKLVMYPEIYAELAALVNEKYDQMGQAAQGYHQNIVVQANNAGFQTRAQLEATASAAIDTYNRMRESGEFTAEELRKAWEAAEKAKQAASSQTAVFTVATAGQMLTSIAGAFEAFGVRSKELAIAGAILQGIAAVQKAWNSAPPPLNLPAVAMVTAATLANIARMRSSQPGFEQGTHGTRFVDFGRGTSVTLHHQEAVVNRRQAGSLAEMLEDAVTRRDMQSAAELRGLRSDMRDRDRQLPILLRDAALMTV